MYEEQRAKVVRVIDGDTIEFFIDCGYYSWTQQRIRVREVDCPEKKDAARWMAARLFTVEWLDRYAQPYVMLMPQKSSDEVFQQTFARFIAHVFSMDFKHSLAYDLTAAGHIK